MQETKWQEEFADIDVHSNIYKSKNPFVRWIHNKRHDLILKMIKKTGAKTVLEIGSGDGYFSKKLLESESQLFYVGIDISKKRVIRAISLSPNGLFVQGDATYLPFKDNVFDVVVASEVLEHIPKYKNVLMEIKRVVKKGGRIIISFPNERNWTIGRLFMLRFPIHFPDHIHSLHPEEFHNFFGKPEQTKTLPLDGLPFNLVLTYIAQFKK